MSVSLPLRDETFCWAAQHRLARLVARRERLATLAIGTEVFCVKSEGVDVGECQQVKYIGEEE